MKRLFLSMMVLLQGVAVCLGQNIPVLHNEEVESRNEYIDGNNYQKDLLLYVDMLKATHPYYADTKHCAQLDKQTRKLYKEYGGIDNDMDFKVCLDKLAASLGDGHTSVPFWMTFNKVFPVRFAFNNNSAIVDVSHFGLAEHHLLEIAQTKPITAQCNRIELDAHQLRHSLVMLLKSGVEHLLTDVLALQILLDCQRVSIAITLNQLFVNLVCSCSQRFEMAVNLNRDRAFANCSLFFAIPQVCRHLAQRAHLCKSAIYGNAH